MTNCIFEPSIDTASATICKWCGEEKFLHTPQLPQQEISDEEIDFTARKYVCDEYEKLIFDYENYDTYNDFINGAKWYREQLKQRQ